MDALTIKNVNAMPAPTWSWLRMNGTQVEVPADLTPCFGASEIDVAEDALRMNGAFELALAALRDKTADMTRERRDALRASISSARGEADPLDLDYPALSRYQRRAALSEDAGDPASDFESGCGADVTSYLNFLAGERATIVAEAGTEVNAEVRVEAEAGCAAAASLDIVAEPGSTLKLALSLNDARPSHAEAAGDIDALVGSAMRIFAAENAKVEVVVYATAGGRTVAIDDCGIIADEGARVNVRHVVLSGALTVTGLACDLRGDRAKIAVDTRYLAHGADVRDFNYVIRHHGKRTESTMDANGVLGGTSRKTLRGTIDLIHGAKGAVGSEQETVLLASEGVDNKTIPSILCDEDDVAGNHGATIGHVRPDQLFYAACRGLSQEQTEALFARAKLDDAAIAAPTERMREDAIRVASNLIPGFEADLEADSDEEQTC